MHILIFCLTSDAVAIALHDALFQKGVRQLRLVTDRELAVAGWLHQADEDGQFFTRIRLQDGFIIEPGMIKNAINRIPYFQMPHFIKQADRLYAEMEITALFNSFLYSIKEKVVDGMPVQHIHHADNSLFFYTMAVKAGLLVMDNQFTSSPRWQRPVALTAMAPQKKQAMLWHKKAAHLVWENKPVLYNEPFSNLVKVEVVGDNFFCSVLPDTNFRKKIKIFSQLTGRSVYECTLAKINNQYKLYSVNTRPGMLSAEAIEAFSSLLISKK